MVQRKQEIMGYDVNKVTRLEVIDKNGRSYVNMNIDSLQLSFQDSSRTLKIFINDKK